MTITSRVERGYGSLQHDALFYVDQEDYLSGIGAFVEAGLAAEEPVLVAVPGPGLELLCRAFGSAGGVRFLDMARAGRNPGRIIPGVMHAFVTEHSTERVRIVGEPIWPGRSRDAYPRCVQHEALINIALADHSVYILCPYDARGLTADVLADAARTHPTLVHEGVRRPSPGYGSPEAVVDSFNLPLPEPVVAPATLIFDPTGLAGMRALVASLSSQAGLPPDRIGDLQIAVNEIATNAVTHAQGPATLRIWPDTEGVVCEISGTSVLTDRLAGRIPPPHTSERGRGLLLVNHLCDLVHVHTDGTSTTVRLHMSR
jgi:anti-sigma regulatory factor (Ser/Thr protein kinase)